MAILCISILFALLFPCRKRVPRMLKLLRRVWWDSCRESTLLIHSLISFGWSDDFVVIFVGSPVNPPSAINLCPSCSWKYRAPLSHVSLPALTVPPRNAVMSAVDATNGPLIQTCLGSWISRQDSYFWKKMKCHIWREWIQYQLQELHSRIRTNYFCGRNGWHLGLGGALELCNWAYHSLLETLFPHRIQIESFFLSTAAIIFLLECIFY